MIVYLASAALSKGNCNVRYIDPNYGVLSINAKVSAVFDFDVEYSVHCNDPNSCVPTMNTYLKAGVRFNFDLLSVAFIVRIRLIVSHLYMTINIKVGAEFIVDLITLLPRRKYSDSKSTRFIPKAWVQLFVAKRIILIQCVIAVRFQ